MHPDHLPLSKGPKSRIGHAGAVDSEKMSKSLGNFFTIRDVLQQYHPLALRWFLVNAQYQTALNYSQSSLEEVSSHLLLGTLHSNGRGPWK